MNIFFSNYITGVFFAKAAAAVSSFLFASLLLSEELFLKFPSHKQPKWLLTQGWITRQLDLREREIIKRKWNRGTFFKRAKWTWTWRFFELFGGSGESECCSVAQSRSLRISSRGKELCNRRWTCCCQGRLAGFAISRIQSASQPACPFYLDFTTAWLVPLDEQTAKAARRNEESKANSWLPQKAFLINKKKRVNFEQHLPERRPIPAEWERSRSRSSAVIVSCLLRMQQSNYSFSRAFLRLRFNKQAQLKRINVCLLMSPNVKPSCHFLLESPPVLKRILVL